MTAGINLPGFIDSRFQKIYIVIAREGIMKKVEAPDGKLEFKFCVEVNEGYNRTTRSVYENASGEYYLVESEEYHIGSAYDYVDVYYALERKKEEALERERIAREDQERMLTTGGDRYFYKKKRSDTVWWLKESGDDHKFSFDKETVYDLMRDYPDKLTPEQKEIFDKENPFWAKRLQKKAEQRMT